MTPRPCGKSMANTLFFPDAGLNDFAYVSGSGNATVTASAFEGSVKQMIASSEKDGNSIPPDKKRSIYLAATSRQRACHVAADLPAPDRIMPACETLGWR